jgi:hypothetical protein
MDAATSLRALVYAGGIVIRGAKIQALIRFRNTRALHDASSDACVRHEARVDWLSYEASVLSATGPQVVVAARSHERAVRSPSAITRSARDGKWAYTADAVIMKISGSLAMDAVDICASIESVIAAQRKPVSELVTHGGALTRLEAARVAIIGACAPSVAKEIAVLPVPEIHAAIAQAPEIHTADRSADRSVGLSDLAAGLSDLSDLADLSDPNVAVMVARAAERDGLGGLRRLHADAACLLHAAGLTDQVGTVLNRIGIAEFDAYAAALVGRPKN